MIGNKFLSIFVASSLALGSMSALSVDQKSADISFTGFKATSKTKVPGNFKTIKVDFKKTDGSAADILNGATGWVDLDSIDTKLPLRNNNIKNLFFSHLSTKELKGVFKDAKGNDTSGTVNLHLDFNGVQKDIPLVYTNKDGKLWVTGNLDLSVFAKSAFDQFANHKTIQGLHSKKTWEVIDIAFSVNVK